MKKILTMKWREVESDPPQKNSHVLGYRRNQQNHIRTFLYDGSLFICECCESPVIEQPTYWMSLPKSPEVN